MESDDNQPMEFTVAIIPLVENKLGLPGPSIFRSLPPITQYQGMLSGKLASNPAATATGAMQNVRKTYEHILCTTMAVPKDASSTHGYVFRWHPLKQGEMCILPLQQLHAITAQKIVITAMLSMIRYGFPRDLVKMIGRLIFQIPNLADHAVQLVCFNMPTNAVDVQTLVEMANHFLSL